MIIMIKVHNISYTYIKQSLHILSNNVLLRTKGKSLRYIKKKLLYPEIKSATLVLSLQQWVTLKDCKCKALAFSVKLSSIFPAYGACIGS